MSKCCLIMSVNRARICKSLFPVDSKGKVFIAETVHLHKRVCMLGVCSFTVPGAAGKQEGVSLQDAIEALREEARPGDLIVVAECPQRAPPFPALRAGALAQSLFKQTVHLKRE